MESTVDQRAQWKAGRVLRAGSWLIAFSHRKQTEKVDVYTQSESCPCGVLPPARLHFLMVCSIALPDSATNWEPSVPN